MGPWKRDDRFGGLYGRYSPMHGDCHVLFRGLHDRTAAVAAAVVVPSCQVAFEI